MKFFKAQVASVTGTAVDFVIATALVHVFKYGIVPSNITGNIAGGVANFYLGRIWVFNNTKTAVRKQFIRYILVWTGNMILNTGGVYLLTHYTKANFVTSKITVSVFLGFFYSYLLQQKFVFKKDEQVEYKL